MQRMKYEQDRRNGKKDRQRENREKHKTNMSKRPPLQTINANRNNNDDNDITMTLNRNQIINESTMTFNTSKITNNIDEYKYSPTDTTNDIKARIKRAVKLARKGKDKKAESGIIADSYENGN